MTKKKVLFETVEKQQILDLVDEFPPDLSHTSMMRGKRIVYEICSDWCADTKAWIEKTHFKKYAITKMHGLCTEGYIKSSNIVFRSMRQILKKLDNAAPIDQGVESPIITITEALRRKMICASGEILAVPCGIQYDLTPTNGDWPSVTISNFIEKAKGEGGVYVVKGMGKIDIKNIKGRLIYER